MKKIQVAIDYVRVYVSVLYHMVINGGVFINLGTVSVYILHCKIIKILCCNTSVKLII